MKNERTLPYPDWRIVREIGSGSFGTVYEIRRELFGVVTSAALKIISIPQSESDVEELRSNGYDEESITAHFESYLSDIMREYALMDEIKGHTNVVYCDDVKCIQKDAGIGWDIYIRMELLSPLTSVLQDSITEGEIVRIGKDICRALELCRRRKIVHRDIKPQNIFVSRDGDYKLGDFGIAKTVERTSGGTKIGTYSYMAPEIYNNRPYGHAADLYSLGLVLYWLLNERRLPFLPLPPVLPKAADTEQARLRRFQGEALPPPAHGSGDLQRIVLKACAYDPADRYASAEEMLAALEQASFDASSKIPLGGQKGKAAVRAERTQEPWPAVTDADSEHSADPTVGGFGDRRPAAPEDEDVTLGFTRGRSGDSDSGRSGGADEPHSEENELAAERRKAAEEAEAKRRAAYDKVMALLAAAKTAEDFDAVASLFEKPGMRDYRDSAERARACRQRAEQLREAAQEQLEKQQENKPRKKGVLVAVIGVVALAALALLLWKVILPGLNRQPAGGNGGVDLSGIGSGTGTTSSPTPTATASPAQHTPTPTATPTPTPKEEGPYKLAKGKFASNADGFAVEPYEYELPLSTTDEVFTTMTLSFTPQYLPEGGMGDLPMYQGMEEQTGVHMEYNVIASASYVETLSVMEASDEMCDVTAGFYAYHQGSSLSQAIKEGLIINHYDWKEYAPNYTYQAQKWKFIDAMWNTVNTPGKTEWSGFVDFYEEPCQTTGYFMRGDWMDQLGLDAADIRTFDEWYDALLAIKRGGFENCDYPLQVYSDFDAYANVWNDFNTTPYLGGPTYLRVVDGRVSFNGTTDDDLALMKYLKKWFDVGLIDPRFRSKTDLTADVTNGSCGCAFFNPSEIVGTESSCVNPKARFEVLHILVRNRGNTIHWHLDPDEFGGTGAAVSRRCNNIPLVVTWLDWAYSPTGADWRNYGPEGTYWTYNKKGEREWNELITGFELGSGWATMAYLQNPMDCGMNCWTRNYKYPGGERLLQFFEVWNESMDYYDGAYNFPSACKLSDEASSEVNRLRTAVNTYFSENYVLFLLGDKPFSSWDSFLAQLESLGLRRIRQIYQDTYDEYLAA